MVGCHIRGWEVRKNHKNFRSAVRRDMYKLDCQMTKLDHLKQVTAPFATAVGFTEDSSEDSEL